MVSWFAGGGKDSCFSIWKEKGLDQACEHMAHNIGDSSQLHPSPDFRVLFLLKSDNEFLLANAVSH